jgi:hypothetical protein
MTEPLGLRVASPVASVSHLDRGGVVCKDAWKCYIMNSKLREAPGTRDKRPVLSTCLSTKRSHRLFQNSGEILQKLMI